MIQGSTLFQRRRRENITGGGEDEQEKCQHHNHDYQRSSISVHDSIV